jgi:hypothetical protein
MIYSVRLALIHAFSYNVLNKCMKEYTYHHLVYGVHYVVHLASGDVSIVVHIVQSEGP